MKQLSFLGTFFYHLYPGILIALAFIFLAPRVIQIGYPPQMAILLSVLLVALPIFLIHLKLAAQKEQLAGITALNGFRYQLPNGKLLCYAVLLSITAFVIWGVMKPINNLVNRQLFGWLPQWYTVQQLKGYDAGHIKTVLIFNVLLNGLLAPVLEEMYFRGYLLPRMKIFGNSAFLINTLLFSFYHFWQPTVYLTLIPALLPMVFFTWKTKDLRLAVLTHCLLNTVGALLSFAQALP